MAPPPGGPGAGEGGVVRGGREVPDDVGEGEGGAADRGATPGAAAAGQNPRRLPNCEKETEALAEDGERGARCRPERDAVGEEGGTAAGNGERGVSEVEGSVDVFFGKKESPLGIEPWPLGERGVARGGRSAGGRWRVDTLNMSRRIWMSNERE